MLKKTINIQKRLVPFELNVFLLSNPTTLGDPTSNGTNLNLIATYQQPQTTLSQSGAVAGLANALYNNYNGQATTYQTLTTSPHEQTAILHLGQTLASVPQESVPYVMNNFANMVGFYW